MDSFYTKEGYPGPAEEISILRGAPEALRAAGVSIVYQRGFAPSEHRLVMCLSLVRCVGVTGL